jgi:hypothetical protein
VLVDETFAKKSITRQIWVNMAWEMYYSFALPPTRIREVSFWWRYCLKILQVFKQSGLAFSSGKIHLTMAGYILNYTTHGNLATPSSFVRMR